MLNLPFIWESYTLIRSQNMDGDMLLHRTHPDGAHEHVTIPDGWYIHPINSAQLQLAWGQSS